MEIKTVGVVGCGLMGSGIAQVCAQAGYSVVVREINDEFLKAGLAKIEKTIGGAVAKGKMAEADGKAVLGRIRGTTRLEDFAGCDLVIEAAIENLDEKKKVFAALDAICGPAAIFASNTSSIPIIAMAAATKRPEQFLGLHFFNPVPVMKLLEIIRTIKTSDETVAAARAFSDKIGKRSILAKDRPGFIVNLLLIPYLLDAIRAYEIGLATAEDIDNGMVLGCAHPMGPLTLLDFVGLDTTYYIANIMFDEFKDAKYAPPPLLKQMVTAGYLGKKSGRGFYDYTKG
ncbi:MAG: 3-hydroxybutyryl-CoA dehydrogenase [Deltaproteobacteria bacterium]|nr:3-hydroxybutyryl-CoA dehydrogenase [Deltaproteobacteria bacterium]